MAGLDGPVCESSGCDLSVDSAEGCPGTTVTLTLTTSCDPECDWLNLELEKSIPWLDIHLPDTATCGPESQEHEFTIDIMAGAPPGLYVFDIHGHTELGAEECSTIAFVTVCGDDPEVAPVCCDGECCPETCEGCLDNGELIGGPVTHSPDVICPGDVITFDAGAIIDSGGTKRVHCNAKTAVPPGEVEVSWTITTPDHSQTIGTGTVASVSVEMLGPYVCEFRAHSERPCPPEDLLLTDTVVVSLAASIEPNPRTIPAQTECSGIPDYSFSEISVTWDPPECAGTLRIIDIEPDSGYTPPSEGWIHQQGDIWRYDAFLEPLEEHHPKRVRVIVGAFFDESEIARTIIYVLPIHTWWTHRHQHGPGGESHVPDGDDFRIDYSYIRCKYAAVLDGVGDGFDGVRISDDACVQCGPFWNSRCVNACTSWEERVEFGRNTFTDSENVAASTIGHELEHTDGDFKLASECDAYTWEVDHQHETGIDSENDEYLSDVRQRQDCECNDNCPEP